MAVVFNCGVSKRYHDHDWLEEKYWGEELTTGEISEICDVHRSTIVRWLDRLDIPTRDTSDYDQKELTKPAREAAEEKYGEGGALGHLWDNRTDEMIEHASANAPLGAPARERNGMTGRTGQDNPNWRGGKSKYLALRKQLPTPSWTRLREKHRGDECENCGATDVQLDLHHIIPILSGGLDEGWNFATLCSSCHRSAEIRIREIAPPVFVE